MKLLRRVWLLFFFASTALTIPLMWLHNFIPSVEVQTQAHGFALVTGLLMTWAFILLARNPEPDNGDAPKSLVVQIGQGIFCGLLMYGASWVNYSLLPGQVFNRLAGEPISLQLSGERDKVNSRHSCNYRLRFYGRSLNDGDSDNTGLDNTGLDSTDANNTAQWRNFWLSHWCIDDQQYQQLGEGRHPFTVKVKQSYWGQLLVAVVDDASA